jgi:hypothetical protein
MFATYSWDLDFGELICHKAPLLNRDHARESDHVNDPLALLLEQILYHEDQQTHDPMIDSVLQLEIQFNKSATLFYFSEVITWIVHGMRDRRAASTPTSMMSRQCWTNRVLHITMIVWAAHGCKRMVWING